METWQWLLNRETAEVLDHCSRRERIRLVAALDHIAKYPFAAGLTQHTTGRKSPVTRAVFGRWAITWWVDFPAKEIHILDIERTGR